jgi:hypothetical protein
MKRLSIPCAAVAVLLTLLGSLARAEPTMEEMEATLLQMQGQMEAMRNQIATLQAQLGAMKDRETADGATQSVSVLSDTPAKVDIHKSDPPSITSKFPLHFYGKVKMDIVYDSNDLGNDEFILFVPQDANGESQTSFTARETRFGLDIGGPTFSDWVTSAKVETDFYGSAPSSGSGSLRIRLAYIDLAKGGTSVRVGQDWLPIATANPATTNFTILGYNGNLWGRIPQVTARRTFNDTFSGYLSTFRCRDVEDDEHGLSCDLNMPWVAAGVKVQGHLIDDAKPATLALGGAYRNGDVEGESVSPNLLSLEFNVPWKALNLIGEAYTGQGLGIEYLHRGGAFNLAGEPIQTQGGFLQLGFQASPSFRFHVGYGFDDPRDEDLVDDEFFRKSTSLFGNVYYDFTKELSLVLEGTRVKTTWSDGPRDGYRVQSSMIFLW